MAVIFVVAAWTAGCSREETHSGTVRNYYTVSVETPVGVDDPTFGWEIVSKPEASRLRFFDLILRSDGRVMTFQPDAPGDYSFEMTVFDADGKAVTDRTYTFAIGEPITEIASTPAPAEPETIEVSFEEEPEPVQDTVEAEPEIAMIEEEPAVGVEPPRQEPRVARKPPPPPRDRHLERVEGKLTIQVSSWPTLEQAQEQANKLKNLGLDAYVQAAPFQDTNELWYRVRVGSFSTYDDANRAAEGIRKATDLTVWVDQVRVDY